MNLFELNFVHGNVSLDVSSRFLPPVSNHNQCTLCRSTRPVDADWTPVKKRLILGPDTTLRCGCSSSVSEVKNRMGYSLANDACHRNSHELQHEEENMTRHSQGNDQGAHKNDKRGEEKDWFPGLDYLFSPHILNRSWVLVCTWVYLSGSSKMALLALDWKHKHTNTLHPSIKHKWADVYPATNRWSVTTIAMPQVSQAGVQFGQNSSFLFFFM